MKLRHFVCSLLALNCFAFAEDALEFQRLQSGYNAAVQRATRPLTQSYIQELSRLRDTYLAANRAPDAQQVENEIKLMTDRIAIMDKPLPTANVPHPTTEVRTPPTTTTGADSHRTLVFDARAKIPANSADGFPLGVLKKGDVVTLQYIDGLWKAFGHVASESPDVIVEQRGHQDDSRLVIARASTNGRPGTVIALVPPLTAKTPFTFPVPEDRGDLVLRINKNSENKGNPGAVTYSLKIAR